MAVPSRTERGRISLIVANIKLLLAPLAVVLALVLAYAAVPSFAAWFTASRISPLAVSTLCLVVAVTAIVVATWVKDAWSKTQESLEATWGATRASLEDTWTATRASLEAAWSARLEALEELAAKSADELEATKAKNLHLESTMADLRIAAFYDVLTGVPNSRYLQRLLSEPRPSKEERCLILLDLENFGEINKKYNHWKGDQYLSKFALMLLQESRRNEYVIKRRPKLNDVDSVEIQTFRRNAGGDEFYLLLNGTVADGLGYLSRMWRRKADFNEMALQLLGKEHKFGFRAGVVSIGHDESYETAAEKVAGALAIAAESSHAFVYWPPDATRHVEDRKKKYVVDAINDFGDPFHEPSIESHTWTG